MLITYHSRVDNHISTEKAMLCDLQKKSVGFTNDKVLKITKATDRHSKQNHHHYVSLLANKQDDSKQYINL